jgi:hypothetical protein
VSSATWASNRSAREAGGCSASGSPRRARASAMASRTTSTGRLAHWPSVRVKPEVGPVGGFEAVEAGGEGVAVGHQASSFCAVSRAARRCSRSRDSRRARQASSRVRAACTRACPRSCRGRRPARQRPLSRRRRGAQRRGAATLFSVCDVLSESWFFEPAQDVRPDTPAALAACPVLWPWARARTAAGRCLLVMVNGSNPYRVRARGRERRGRT